MSASAPASLTPEELLRYARHLTLDEIGVAGQQRLRAARVLLVGAGGLGSPAALYLAAAGVGTLGIVDDDRVDLSNLQRQVIHDTAHLGALKTASARDRLAALNPHVSVELFDQRLDSGNARATVRAFDLVIDGSDNFPTRYLVNDACVLERRPLVYGSVLRFEGQVSLFALADGPCYRCLFREPPPPELVPNCADAGVLGVLPGIIGSLQALIAMNRIVGAGAAVSGRLLLFDGLTLRCREVAVSRDPECVICGDHPTLTELIDYAAFCDGGRTATLADAAEISPRELHSALASAAPPAVIDVREPWEYRIAHVAGTQLIPLGELASRLGELPRGRELVTVCHHGARSLQARDFLLRAGFGHVRSLAGGVDGWARELDPGMPRY
jgi:adenylyltransferase/sulfurtransferase